MSGETAGLAAWGLSSARIEPLAGGTANRNFIVTHPTGRYVLRERSPRYSDPRQIEFDHALMRCLAEHGVRGPNPLLTRAGETSVRVGETVFELHRYLPGNSLAWHDLGQLRRAAQALRRFHDATSAFEPPVAKNWPREDSPDDIKRGLAELAGEIAEEEGRTVLSELSRWAHRIAAALPDDAFWALPCQVIHGDFHPGNVNVSEEGFGLFDLDCASRQPRARDLADGILYFCARRDGPFDASTITRLTRECWLDPERNKVFLDAYGAISREEYEALPWLVAARWIYSRVRGRLKVPRKEWSMYALPGLLAPLEQLPEGLLPGGHIGKPSGR